MIERKDIAIDLNHTTEIERKVTESGPNPMTEIERKGTDIDLGLGADLIIDQGQGPDLDQDQKGKVLISFCFQNSSSIQYFYILANSVVHYSYLLVISDILIG